MKAATSKTRKATTSQASKIRADEGDAQACLRMLRRQGPQVEKSLVESIDRDFDLHSGMSISRRIALQMLTLPGQQLIDFANGDLVAGEALADACVRAGRLSKQLRAIADLVDTSHIRLMVAICTRKDSIDLLNAAEAFHKVRHG